MRMRKKKNLLPRMERCEDILVRDPFQMRGHWRERFRPDCELRLEIGCGKGRFTVETAAAEPDVFFVAVERVPDAMVIAMERAKGLGLTNVAFVCGDAAQLEEMFAPGEVDRIYINFCDPWPSKRHAKRRLTFVKFLLSYRNVLSEGGQIHFKTDNRPLFDFSLTQFPKAGFTLSEVTNDLHANGTCGVMTDYEAKFSAEGVPINRCVGTMGELPVKNMEEELEDTLSKWEIHPVEEDEYEEVLALQKGNQDFFDSIHSGAFGVEEVAESIRELPPNTRPEQKHYLGLWHQEKLAAVLDYVEGYPEEDMLWIGFFMVRAELHRTGTGRTLIHGFQTAAQAQGFRSIQLGCNVENTDGRAFWTAMGFRSLRMARDLNRPEREVEVMEYLCPSVEK